MLRDRERKYIVQKTKDLEVRCTISFEIGALPLSVYLSLYENELSYKLKYLSEVLQRINEVNLSPLGESVSVSEEELIGKEQYGRLSPIVKL